MKKLLFILLCFPACGFAMDRLSALSMLETGDDDFAVGRAGEISRYQVLKSEWRSVTKSVNYADSETARTVVLRLMEKRIQAFKANFGRLPNDFEYYGLWNAPSQVMQSKVSPVVAARCRRFVNLCERDQQVAQISGRKVF